jgi:hypothetical protein
MSSLITKYLDILNSLSIDAMIGIIYNCFSDFSFKFNCVTLEQLDDWIENYPGQKIKDTWIKQRTMKHPHMIFFFMMMDIRDNTLRDRCYKRNISNSLQRPNIRYDIVKSIRQDMAELSILEGITFLGELIGAWMLTCPRRSIRRYANRTRNWEPQFVWRQEIYPDTLAKDIPPDELELLFILDYYLLDTFELILHHNTLN